MAKRINWSLRAVFPFVTMFSKVIQGRQKASVCGKGLICINFCMKAVQVQLTDNVVCLSFLTISYISLWLTISTNDKLQEFCHIKFSAMTTAIKDNDQKYIEPCKSTHFCDVHNSCPLHECVFVCLWETSL